MRAMSRIIIVLVAALALGAIGCGDDDENTTTDVAEEVEAGEESASDGIDTTTETETTDATETIEPSGEEPGSEEDFIAEADAICAELNERAAEFEDADDSLEELAISIPEVLVIYDEGIAQLEALEAPTPELEAQMETFLATVRVQADLVAELGDAAAAGDEAAIEVISLQLEQAVAAKEDAAAAAGFAECGTGGN